MKQITPSREWIAAPCGAVAIGCATGQHRDFKPSHNATGYTTLQDMNKLIRKSCSVKKRIDYKRGERPKLQDLHLNGRAIVCVYGHYLYLDRETYWSFFNNEYDDVVTVWVLKD